MKEPLRILQLNSGSVNFGGVSSFLYNIYSHIDRDVIQFDFLSPDKTTYEIHRKDIEDMGGKIFEFNIKGNILTKKIKLYIKLKNFLKKNKYRIVHINSGNFFFNLFVSAAVKSACVPVRIIHSHNAGDTENKFKHIAFSFMKPLMEKNATHFFACSMLAAEYMFTEKILKSGNIKIIPNGIDTDRFAFSQDIRDNMRRTLGMEDKFIVGNVARFMLQKNHRFLIEVFEKISEKKANAVLVLVGQGELLDEIKALVHTKNLDDKVFFLGQRSDVDKLYQAMDVFVLTSFHEGFPVTGVEVQCCGLPFILSDSITKEIKLVDNTYFISLESSPDKWADIILNCNLNKRCNNSEIIKGKGYSEDAAALELSKLYLSVLENEYI